MRNRVLSRAAISAAILALAVSAVATGATNGTPIVSVPADFSAEGDILGGWQSWYAPTATDPEDGSLAVTCTPASGAVFPVGTTTVTCSATDSAGETGSASFVVTVTDTTVPMLTSVPALIWAETPDPSGDIVGWPEPWAVDTVDGLVPVTCSPASGSHFTLGATPVVCSAADNSGNVDSSAFMVYLTLVDSVAPVLFDVPSDVVVDATETDGDTVSWPPLSAVDNIDGPLPVTCAPASGTFFDNGVTTVTCTATDSRGNVGTATFTVTVNPHVPVTDTTPPVLGGLPADIAVETTDPSGTVVTWDEPWANDDVDGPLPVNCTPASGSVFEVGPTTVECSATDAAGNDGTAAPFTVQVTLIDTTPPVLSGVPAGIDVNATIAAGRTVSWTAPTAVDNIDGPVTVTCTPASGSHFRVGTTTVTCTASDAAGNDAGDSFSVRVTLIDETPPVLSGVPGGFNVTTTNAAGRTVSWTAPTAVDNIDGPVGVTCTPASGSVFSVGPTTVTCTASDAAGNVASDSFSVRVNLIVIVVDTTPPTLSGVPDGIDVNTTDAAGRTVSWTAPTAVDNIDGPVGVTCTPASGSVFSVGPTTVTCTASDAAGNVASDSFSVRVNLIVIVVDTTPPTLSGVPDGIDVNTTDAAGRTVSWTAPTAVDNIDGPVGVTCTPASGSVFSVGPTTVTCTASDAAGNVASDSFSVRVNLIVIVVDTTPPTLSGVPADITVQASSTARMAVTWPAPTAVDDRDGSVPVTCTPASGSAFPVGTTTVNCRATDAAGNFATGSFKVTVTEAAPDPAPVAKLDVKWAKPIGKADLYKTKVGTTLELKAKISVNGVVLKKHASKPKLVVERLASCGGTVVERRDGGKLKWDDGAWRLDLKTSKLGVGCWRVSVAVGTAEGGAFVLDVRKKSGHPKHHGDDRHDGDD